MSATYVIRWASKVNGRAGKGTNLFSQEKAEQLVQELNEEYPHITHEAVLADTRDQTEAGAPEASSDNEQIVSVE